MVKIIYNIHYQFTELQPERELQIRGKVIEEYIEPKQHNQRRFLIEILKGCWEVRMTESVSNIIILIIGLLFTLKAKRKTVIRKERLMIRREGMPQGLSVSPLLSTLAIELLEPPKGLIMYADDGLHLSKNGDHTEFIT